MVKISYIFLVLVALLVVAQSLSAEAAKSFKGKSRLQSRDVEHNNLEPRSFSTASQVLAIHNRLRAKHRAPPLKWSTKLADYAQKWANNCVWNHTYGPYGENLAGATTTWDAVISAWYNEGKKYSYKPPTGFTLQTGHFTQIVWRGTKEIGCGVVHHCPANKHMPWVPFYVCEYYPPGNIVGDNNNSFKKNVLPPK